MKEYDSKYIRCRTCGRYIDENQSINNIYCSEQCANIFTRCRNCGNFFLATDNNRRKDFCSIECEAVYSDDGLIISSEIDISKDESNNT